MEYILNKLRIDTGNWTQFEFFEFATLISVYSKTVYRFLKQYRKTGFWKVSLEDFKSLLSILKAIKHQILIISIEACDERTSLDF